MVQTLRFEIFSLDRIYKLFQIRGFVGLVVPIKKLKARKSKRGGNCLWNYGKCLKTLFVSKTSPKSLANSV